MQLINRLSLLIAIPMLLFSCSEENTDVSNASDDLSDNTSLTIPADTPYELEVLGEINDYRLSEGLGDLDIKRIIKTQTQQHTDYMIENGAISHDNFVDRELFLMDATGAERVGEIVAFGYETAEDVMQAWLNSEGHKRVMEGDTFTHYELTAKQDSNGYWFYTCIFVKL